MPPKKLFPKTPSSPEDILRLAELHYVTEQKIRAWHVWSGDIDPAALSFDRSWPQIHHHLRNVYIDRVKYILFSSLGSYAYLDEDEEGHPSFFKKVYTSYYEKMDAEVIRKEVVMPASTFKELFAYHLGNVKVSTPLISLRETQPERFEKQPEPKIEKNVLFTHSARQRKLDRWHAQNPDAGSPGSSIRTSTGSTNTATYQPGFDCDSDSDLLTRLETATTKGVQTLKDLQYLLLKDPTSWKFTSESTCYWPAEISKVKAHAESVRTIIGVLGVPGAGKTSLINAIVGEEGLLPTNCMRASTAVVTEVAYNDHSAAKYRAEIEFVCRASWNQELKVLVRDMNDHGRGEEILPPEGDVFRSEAAAAVEKIRAVYPMLSVEEIMDSSAEDLCDREILAGEVLGETVVIENEDPRVFSRALAAYIDSKGKKKRTPNPSNKNPNGNASSDVKGKAPMRTIFDNSITSSPSATEYWPFVRVVRIYVKAKALYTGATLVDLPSIIDSNAQRAAVAQEYMQKCHAHWIVSPINGAINERVARDLLSPNLRLQLHMDVHGGGLVDDLTFVCTKTDDVSVSEVQEALLRRDLPSPSLGSERSVRCKELGQDVRILDKRLAQIVSEAMEIDERVERLLGRDSPASDERGSPGKRKRDTATSRSSSRSSRSSSNLGTAQLDEEDSDTEEETIFALNERRRDLVRQRRTILNEITAKKIQQANLEAEIEDQKINFVHDCIIARNEYTKRDLQRDFAHGIHDFCNQVQGLLSTASSGAYHGRSPEQKVPVFCVSTRASQKFKGRLRKEASVYGFAKLEETEVPQLQEHCIQITKKAREDSALRFLLQLRQLLNSISLWASAGGGMRVWKQQRDEVEARVRGAIEMFKKEVKAACDGSMKVMCDIITTNLVRRLDDASSKAKSERPELVKKWTDIRIHTYRAICRRLGAFGNHNWNQDLATLFIEPLMNGWKNAFEVEIPLELDWFAESIKNHLQAFHIQAITSTDGMLSDMDVEILQNTWKTQYETMEREVKLINRVVSKSQREMNRLFAKVLRIQLEMPYMRSSKDRTKVGNLGDYIATYKYHFTNGVDTYDISVYRTKSALSDFLDQIENTLNAVAQRMVEQITRDYLTCIVTPLVEQFTSRQLRFKKEVAEATYAAERDLELEDLLDEAQFGKGGREEEGEYYDDDDDDYYYDDGQENQALAYGDVQPLKRVLESIKEEEGEDDEEEKEIGSKQ